MSCEPGSVSLTVGMLLVLVAIIGWLAWKAGDR